MHACMRAKCTHRLCDRDLAEPLDHAAADEPRDDHAHGKAVVGRQPATWDTLMSSDRAGERQLAAAGKHAHREAKSKAAI